MPTVGAVACRVTDVDSTVLVRHGVGCREHALRLLYRQVLQQSLYKDCASCHGSQRKTKP